MSQKKRAIVIGGTSGIGRSIAAKLKASSYDVSVTGVSEAGVSEAASRDGVTAYRLDVGDQPGVEALFASLGQIDVLVNCAGTNRRKGQEFDPETFEYVVGINLFGTMRACYAAYPHMKKQGGTIVNIASMFSTFGSGSIPAYAASKGAVAALTRSLAIAWAKDQIRVNAIAPGFIETKLTQDVVADRTRVAEVVGRTPMGRWGQPDEMAGAAAYLCSDDAGFVTGTILTVDGGYSVF